MMRDKEKRYGMAFRRPGLSALVLMLAVLAVLAAGSRRELYAAGRSSLPKKIVLYQGQSKKLKLKGASAPVEWSSTNPEIAQVSAKGKVFALKPGKCSISAVCGQETYSCRIRVRALAFKKPALTMICGRKHKLVFNCDKVKNASWTSSDPKAAVVENGIVTAKQPGNAVITAVWKGIPVRCSITVKRISPENLDLAYPATKENRGKILLAGSSSVDFWESAMEAFAPHEIINTAIAGTTVLQWICWYQQLITRYKPKAVVLYVGSNDLGNGGGISGEENAANTISLLKKISKKLKKVPIFYLSVNPCWFRRGAWGKIGVSNSMVKRYCAGKKNLYYIDIASAFALPDGTPDPALFLKDQLHPSAAGYKVWKKTVAKKVKKVLKKKR